MTNFVIPTLLENDNFRLELLQPKDFEEVYQVASDPEVWAQHPSKNRCERNIFESFFEGAMQSKAAYKIIDKSTDQVIGSTRFYDYNQKESSILIGYTFYARSHWGKGANPQVKKIMLDYAFQFVSKVIFHVAAENMRSRTAMEKLGATQIAEIPVAYHGEKENLNVIYEITKVDWLNKI